MFSLGFSAVFFTQVVRAVPAPSPTEPPQEGVPQDGGTHYHVCHRHHGGGVHRNGRRVGDDLRRRQCECGEGVTCRRNGAGEIISVLPSNSFENIVISIGMVVSLMGSIPLFLEAAGEIVENGMGRSAGRVVIVRSSEVWKGVYREQEAVDYAHRGEPGVVPDRLSVPSFYGHSRFEYPCVARCCQILNGDSEALRRLSLRLRFRRSCIWSSLTRS